MGSICQSAVKSLCMSLVLTQNAVDPQALRSGIPVKAEFCLVSVNTQKCLFQGDTVLHLGRYTLNTYIEAMALPKTQNTDLDSRVIAILSHTRKNS